MLLKILKYSQEKILCQGLFLSCNFIEKETLAQGFCCEFCKIFKISFLKEHLWMTASILQHLLSLYFAITYSWLATFKSGKKIIHIFQGFYRFRFLLHRSFFSFFLYAKRMLYSMQPTASLVRRHLNTMLLPNFEHFGHFPRNTQALTDPLIICVYLRTTNRNFHDQKNFRQKYFSEPFFGISCFSFKWNCFVVIHIKLKAINYFRITAPC